MNLTLIYFNKDVLLRLTTPTYYPLLMLNVLQQIFYDEITNNSLQHQISHDLSCFYTHLLFVCKRSEWKEEKFQTIFKKLKCRK